MGCGESEASPKGSSSIQKSKSATQSKPVQQQQTSSSPIKPSSADEIQITPAQFSEGEQDVKILTLGAGECGKSTLWRQVKRLYCGGFSNAERLGMRRTIRQTIIEDMKDLIDSMERNALMLAQPLQPLVETIKDLDPNDDELDEQVARAVAQIWADPMMRTVYQSANSIGLGENIEYFLGSVERISDPNYQPPDEDILKARIRTVGIAQLQFKIVERKALLVDVGGQKAERRNWTRCFQGVQYLLFVVSLSDFDQLMFEDRTTKRTDDSMNLFNQIANSHIFEKVPIFLVLNKLDVFKKKIATSPDAFRDAYPGFSGDISNLKDCLDHVKQSFLQQLNSSRDPSAWVEVLSITAMEPDSVRTFVQQMAKKIMS